MTDFKSKDDLHELLKNHEELESYVESKGFKNLDDVFSSLDTLENNLNELDMKLSIVRNTRDVVNVKEELEKNKRELNFVKKIIYLLF